MALDPAAIVSIYDALMSHSQALGIFQQTVDHEPRSMPGPKLTCAVLLGDFGPAPRGSGLASTSARLEFSVRIYSPAMATPDGARDRDVLSAACQLMAAYSGDFEFENVPEGLIRNVDLLGAYGDPLKAQPGWLQQDGGYYRIEEITVPLILNDVFAQVA
jgi:hypothetical protein